MLNTELPCDPTIPFLGTQMKTYVHAKTCKQMLTALLFVTAKGPNNPNLRQLMTR